MENEIIDFYSEQQARQYSVSRKPHSAGDVGRNLVSVVYYAGLSRTVSVNDACTEIIRKPIDYSKAEDKLDAIRENGIGYLKTALLK